MKYSILIPLLLLAGIMITNTSCNKKENRDIYLLNNFEINNPENLKLSELFGNDYRIITIGDTYANQIGRINKIVKRKNNFFLLTNDKTIFQFNDEGTLVSVLDRHGNGPGEYNRIEDFDVYEENNELVLWISDFSTIKIYKYNGKWEQANSIEFSFVVNKFKKINPNRILTMTGQNDKSLTLCNTKGDVLAEFLDKEIPFLTFKPVQFVRYDSIYIFPLGMSDSFVSFNIYTEKFNYGKYTSSKYFLKKNELLELYSKYGYDFFLKIKQTSYIKNIRRFGKQTVIDFYKKGFKYIAFVSCNSKTQNICLSPNATFINDITNKENARFLFSLFLAESDDSLLFIEEPEEISGQYKIIEFFVD